MDSRVEAWLASQPWLARQRASYEALVGQEVLDWHGVEMALDGDEDDDQAIVWDHVDVPFLQFYFLTIVFGEQEVRIRTAQGYDSFGLWNLFEEEIPAVTSHEWSGIYRARTIHQLPVGRIRAVDVAVQDDVVASVVLRIGDKQIALTAGEVYPTGYGSFYIADMDESVLIQVDGRKPDQSDGPSI